MALEKRNLSGIYFRSQLTDGTWDNVVFEDLSEKEQDAVLEDRSEEWLKSLAKQLASTTRKLGDQFDLMAD